MSRANEKPVEALGICRNTKSVYITLSGQILIVIVIWFSEWHKEDTKE